MWKCKWVHRDISPGNIVVFDGRGILLDFEYAKRYAEGGASNATHEVRTVRKAPMRVLPIITLVQGTINYMAVEIALQRYMFAPTRPRADRNRASTSQNALQQLWLLKYNGLHDLESHWWVTVWAILSRCVRNTGLGYRAEDHKTVFRQMFPGATDTNLRTGFMDRKYLRNAINKNTFPEEFDEALETLDSLRKHLVELYTNTYKPFAVGEQASLEVLNQAHPPHLELVTALAEQIRSITQNDIVSLWETEDQPTS